MQKVIQRTTAARKQASKKAIKLAKKENAVNMKEDRKARTEYKNILNSYVKTARQNRYEDWLKGPLAPKRDSGLDATTYGALDARLVHPPRVPKLARRKYILFAPGDRICIVKGPETGKIGEVSQLNEDSETVFVKELNKSDVVIPEFAKLSMGAKEDIIAQDMPIPLDNIRHVIALQQDDMTTQDYIVQYAYGGEPFYERGHNSKVPRFTRYISGLDIEIPWPREELPDVKDGEWDTLRFEVETPTWVPSLDNSPFPSSVLDELRHKYSRFRTRHDPEFVKTKKMDDYKKQYLESRTLLTPLGEFRLQQKTAAEERRKSQVDADGNRIMDDETRRFIEHFMQKRAAKTPKQNT